MQFMFSRKSGIVLAALLGVQLILPASGWALTGRDVALKADQVDTSRTSDMSMAMIIKRGDQQLVRFMAMKKKKFPDSEKQHIRFLEPGDIRNTASLRVWRPPPGRSVKVWPMASAWRWRNGRWRPASIAPVSPSSITTPM